MSTNQISAPGPTTKKEARAQLAALLDQLSSEDIRNVYHPTSLIGKAIFRAFDLGLNFNATHTLLRSHFHKHKILHSVWWTKDVARVAWERAEQRHREGAE